MLRKRGRAKLNVLCHTFSCSGFLSRYSDVSAIQCQLNDFSSLYSGTHDFDRLYYYSIPQYCDNNFDNFVDDSLADFDESVNFLNFSVDNAPHVSLNRPFEVSHQENSHSNNNRHFDRHFDKQQRKRSYRRDSHQSDRLHPMHHPIDLSSRTDTPIDEINLLSKGPSFCPIPRDINWYKC